jgi:hypothetical protein
MIQAPSPLRFDVRELAAQGATPCAHSVRDTYMKNRESMAIRPCPDRAVLDLATDLERLGDVREAARIRAQAIGAYSAAWDPRTLGSRRRLAGLATLRAFTAWVGRRGPKSAGVAIGPGIRGIMSASHGSGASKVKHEPKGKA